MLLYFSFIMNQTTFQKLVDVISGNTNFNNMAAKRYVCPADYHFGPVSGDVRQTVSANSPTVVTKTLPVS